MKKIGTNITLPDGTLVVIQPLLSLLYAELIKKPTDEELYYRRNRLVRRYQCIRRDIPMVEAEKIIYRLVEPHKRRVILQVQRLNAYIRPYGYVVYKERWCNRYNIKRIG